MALNDRIKLVATDLDGTLLRTDSAISTTDWLSFVKAGEQGVVRVVATGRSMFKVMKVLPPDSPFDFIVFSSGAGIYDWNRKTLLHSEAFAKPIIAQLCAYLLSADYNFIAFHPIPNNNLFYYHQGAGACPEFEHYLARHTGDYTGLDPNSYPAEAGQIMAVIPNNDELFERLKRDIYNSCNGVKVIRATSPVNPEFIWLEIFPETVSKGHGLKWVCDYMNIDSTQTIGIGNDYNDSDMFDFVGFPFLLKNGVDALKNKYHTVDFSNDEDGVTAVINKLLFTNS